MTVFSWMTLKTHLGIAKSICMGDGLTFGHHMQYKNSTPIHWGWTIFQSLHIVMEWNANNVVCKFVTIQILVDHYCGWSHTVCWKKPFYIIIIPLILICLYKNYIIISTNAGPLSHLMCTLWSNIWKAMACRTRTSSDRIIQLTPPMM